MPPKKNSASQLEGGPKAPVGPLRRQLSLRAFRDRIPTKEAAVAESRRIINEGASVFGKRLNDARVVFGSLSQTFKRTTKRRKPLVESPATPAKGRRSNVDLYSPFGIESPAKRQPGRSTYVTPRRRYHDNAASSERRATLRSAAAYRNGGLDVSDVVTPAGKKTPGLSSSTKRRSARAAAVTPGLSADVESINEGMRRLRAVAHRMSGENEATPMR